MQAKHYLVFQFVFIWQDIVSSQGPNAIFRLENSNVKMTIKITPNVSQPVTTIRLDRRDGSPTEIVAFIYLADFGYEIQTAYSERLSLTTSAQERIVVLFMSGLRPSDAGTYQCWDGALQATIIENCGQKLIIVRKPNQPIIFSLTKALKGNTLELSCNASSTSLPADHGLKQAIVWLDEQNTIIGIPAGEKFVVNPNSQLEIRNLEHSDIGRKLTCTSSEKAEGLATTPVSEPSLPYQIRLEGAPTEKDIRLTPPIRNKAKIIRREQERLSYNCSAECEPRCTVQWTFETLNSQTPLNLSNPGVLKLRVKQEDHGVYRCIANNTFGEASKEFKLEVQYIHKPVLFGSGPVQDKSCIEVKETAKLSLTCIVDALPEPEISWKSPDVKELSAVASRPYLLDNDLPNNHSLQLLLKSVQLEDSGGYICEASNVVDFVYAMVNISVVGPPSVVNMYGLQLYPVYFRDFLQNVSLNISFVVKSVTEPSVESVTSKRIDSDAIRIENMTSDVSIEKVTKKERRYHLTIFTFSVLRPMDIQDKDSTFTLTLTNSNYSRDVQFVLKDIGPPRPVTNITALEITHEAVQLMWIPGPNGGVEQLFNLEYRCLNNRICGSNWMPAILAVPENITQANLANLKPATEYEFRVVSTNSHGSTESQPLLVRIGERIVMTTSVTQTDQSNTMMAVVIVSVVAIFVVIITIYELVQKCKCGRCKSGGP